MNGTEHDANYFLYWIDGNQEKVSGLSRDQLIQLHEDIGKLVHLRQPHRRLQTMYTPELLEEVAFACITLQSARYAARILEALTPGRAEFELLCQNSVLCMESYVRYRKDELSWSQAIDEATASVLAALSAAKERLHMSPLDLTPLGDTHKVQDKVRYLALLVSLLRDHVDAEMKHLDPVHILLPGLTAVE